MFSVAQQDFFLLYEKHALLQVCVCVCVCVSVLLCATTPHSEVSRYHERTMVCGCVGVCVSL